MMKRVDLKGIVHWAERPTSTFSACTKKRPTVNDFTVSLAYPGKVPETAVVTCFMCLVMNVE